MRADDSRRATVIQTQNFTRTEMNEHLSPRQSQILSLVAKGCGDKEIADLLQCSPHTIGTHMRTIFAKLDCVSRAEAVCIWLQTPEPSHKRVTAGQNASAVN